MDDTETRPDTTTTDNPEVVSTSSIQPAESTLADDSLANLGERILSELGDERTNDTLTRWLAHHTAELICAADASAGSADAGARAAAARTAILELWDHRSSWPNGWPPPRATQIVRLLQDLPELGQQLWYPRTVLAQLQDLHHHVLAAIVDMATFAGEPTEDEWLTHLGDALTPAELAVLRHAAGTQARLDRLTEWSEQSEPGDGADSGPRHPLARLADTYRRTVLALLQHGRNDETEIPGNADGPGGPQQAAD